MIIFYTFVKSCLVSILNLVINNKLIMKKTYTLKTFLFAIVLISIAQVSSAQCPQIVCPSDITVNNDPGICGAVVNFTPPVGTNPCGTTSATFNYTGAMQTWTVPVGVTSISIDAYGAQGANGIQGNFDGGYWSTLGGVGGLGGRSQGSLVVTPGQTINIYVGGQNGWNGGGGTGTGFGANGGTGGGASDIRVGGTNLTDRVLVAAGGGGGGGGALNQICSPGVPSNGGDGSGGGSNIDGGTGTSGGGGPGFGTGGYANGTGGPGGSGNQSGTAGGNGSLGQGGNGGGTTYPVPPYANGVTGKGGGGGGGYNGGGAGGAAGYNGGCGAPGGGGAGGSSYTGGVTGGTTTASVQSSNGQVIITWSSGITTTTLTAGHPSGYTFPVGTTVETYTATDQLSNSVSCSFNITVVDTAAPTFICPSDITTCEGSSISILPTNVTDNCPGVVTITYVLSGATIGSGSGDASNETFNPGLTTVTYFFNDVYGNQDSCSFIVTVASVDTSVVVSMLTLTAATSDTYQWYNCNTSSIIPGATGNSYTATVNGSYAVIVTQNGCTDTSSCHIINSVGINESVDVNTFTVYPNPAKGQLNIVFDKLSGRTSLTLFDVYGKKIITQNVLTLLTKLDVQSLAAGVYYLQILNNNNSSIKKVMIE